MQKEQFYYVNESEINTDNRTVGLFFEQINSFLPSLIENGIHLKTADQIISYLENPSQLYSDVMAIAEKDAGLHILAKNKEVALNAGKETAKELKENLIKCLNLKYGTPFEQHSYLKPGLSLEVLAAIKSYIKLKDGKLILLPGYEKEITTLRTYRASETGQELGIRLNNLLEAAKEYENFCNLKEIEDRIKLEGKFISGINPEKPYLTKVSELKINNEKICTTHFKN